MNMVKRIDGIVLGPIVIIKYKCKDDKSLLHHELVHVNQWYETLGLFPLLYLFKKYRLAYEVEAYAESLLYNSKEDRFILVEKYAELLSSDIYKLGISFRVAKMMLLFMMEERIKMRKYKK